MLAKLAACSVLVLSVASAAQKAKPLPKSPAKPAQTKPAPPPTAGPARMPSDKGEFWVAYQMGAKDAQLNLTLETASLALRVPTADDSMVAASSEKLLVLTFTVQNPLHNEQVLDPSSFHFTCVSPDDDTFEYAGHFYVPESKRVLTTTLKPLQKERFMIPFAIHGVGQVNHLTVKRGDDAHVLQFNLGKQLKLLKGAFAMDGGISAAPEAESKLGIKLPLGKWDVVVESFVESRDNFADFELGDDEKWVSINIAFTNPNMTDLTLNEEIFEPLLFNQASDRLVYQNELLTIGGADDINQVVKPGETVRARYLFKHYVPSMPRTFTLRDTQTGRLLTIALKK